MNSAVLLGPSVEAAPLRGAGSGSGVPDLALDLLLVDGFELDGENFLCQLKSPPLG